MSNLKCDAYTCSNNTGFTHECMFGVTNDLILRAKSDNSMCNLLRHKVLEYVQQKGLRKYIKWRTGECIFINPIEVWHNADPNRLKVYRNVTIYMTPTTFVTRSDYFKTLCDLRNIKIEVVHR